MCGRENRYVDYLLASGLERNTYRTGTATSMRGEQFSMNIKIFRTDKHKLVRSGNGSDGLSVTFGGMVKTYWKDCGPYTQKITKILVPVSEG